MNEYARIFDETSSQWRKETEYNLMFLQGIERFMNDALIVRGHVFLNEIYDMLGINRSSAGAIVGWIKNGEGDSYIDFGMRNKSNDDLLLDLEKGLRLEFNVDGVIYDKIDGLYQRKG